MTVHIPISERARKYGYLIWPKKLEEEIRKLLPDRGSVHVLFDSEDLGERRIDWKYRRISVGPSQTRRLRNDVLTFEVTCPVPGQIAVRCL